MHTVVVEKAKFLSSDEKPVPLQKSYQFICFFFLHALTHFAPCGTVVLRGQLRGYHLHIKAKKEWTSEFEFDVV